MEFRVLGPLEVHAAGGPLPLGSGRRLRSLLALFLAQPGRVLSTDALVTGLWPGEPPPSFSTGLRVHLTRLRARLEPERAREAPSDRLVTEPGGYRLRVEPDELDALRFEQLVTLARRAESPAIAVDAYSRAEALWRGAAFADLDDVDLVRAEAVRLTQLRIGAREESFDLRLAAGDHAALVSVVQQAVDEHPLRERLAGQLMLALYRSGRQAEALRAYAQLRARLGDELGIEPDPAISRLETAIIRHEHELDLAVPVSRAIVTAERPVTLVAADPKPAAGAPAPRGVAVMTTAEETVLAFDTPDDALACAAALLEACPDAAVGISAGDRPAADNPMESPAVREALALRGATEPGWALASGSVALLAGSRSSLAFGPVTRVAVRNGETIDAARGRLPARAVDNELIPLPRLLADEDGGGFAGRGSEIGRLDLDRHAVAAGAFKVVLVSGEAGVGKTRLAARVARLVHDDGWTVLYGRCEDGIGPPFQTFVDPLAHFVEHTPDELLVSRLGRHAGELTRLLPALAARLPTAEPPVQSDSETERHQLFRAVADWLRASARARPLLLVVDDVHWAALPTLLLLRHLVRTPDLDRVLVLIAYRDTTPELGEGLEALLGDLAREPRVARVPLDGLDVHAVREMLVGSAGLTSDESTDDLARELQAETGGNPFFVRELLRERPDPADRDRAPAITPTIRDVIAQRFARLPPDVEQLLTVAAVIGRDFDFALLREATGTDEDDALYTLDAARGAGLVHETGFDQYRFAHALVRAALYQPLTETRRVRLHLRVGEALERIVSGHPDGRLPELAHHFLEAVHADGVDRAVTYTIGAAEVSMQQLAFEDAADLCRRAERAVEDARSRGRAVDPSVECDLVLLLGRAEWRAGQPGARRRLLRAFELARALGDADRIADAALAMNRGFFARVGRSDRDLVPAFEHAIEVLDAGDLRRRAQLMAALASELVWTDERERRTALSNEALALARDAGDPRTLATVLLLRNMTIASPDTLAARLEDCDELLAIARELRDPAVEFHAAFHRSGTALEAGDAEAANEMVERAWQLASDLNQPRLLFHASMMRTSKRILEGGLDDAERGAHETYELGQRANQGGEAVIYFTELMLEIRRWQSRLGEMLDEFGDLAGVEGIDLGYPLVRYLYDAGECDRALQLYAGIIEREPLPPRRDLLVGPMLCNLAYLAARAGDASNAPRLYELLRPLAGFFANSTVAKPIAEHHLGMLAVVLDDASTAADHFAVATAAHERIGAPLLTGETKLEWAALLRRTGDTSRADELTREAQAIGSACGAAYLMGAS